MIPIISASSPKRSTITTSICQDEATITQGLPQRLLLFAYSPSLPTMLHESTWLNFVDLPDKNTSSDPCTFVEGYGKYSRGPESAGVGGIMSNDTHH